MIKTQEIRVGGSLETSVCKCGPDATCKLEAVLSIDERGQMILPKDVREKIGINTGDKFALISWGKNGKICCLALTKVENLNDSLKDLLEPLLPGQK
ncbi:HgcAB-associated protein HgcC [Methanoregula sp.]|uniref:HgcAB-associated protein HgcC n=1 Tax=Methanoregula sp. TaxID=2052170 RepID=UPI00356A63AD